jgi:uroporphyrinogen-III synthase
MGSMAVTVLVTRPEPGAGETAARLRARGVTPILAPMLEISPVAGPPPPAADAILLTSRSGLLGLTDLSAPVFAVGAATAAAARAGGASAVASADGDAAGLAALVQARIPHGARLLLPTAEGQGTALAETLRAAEYVVHLHIAYAVRPAETLPAEAAEALAAHRIDHALFFSAETARAFVLVVRHHGIETAMRTIAACAISAATEVALSPFAWRRLRVAARPNQDSLLALIE